MNVHSELGPGLKENFYHLALYKLLRSKKIACDFKSSGKLIHRGYIADEFEADLIVDQAVIVELKALSGTFCPEHYAQLMCYQKFWTIKLGFLMDFCKEKLAYERIIYTSLKPSINVYQQFKEEQSSCYDKTILERISNIIQRIYDQYGLGYRDTTYKGLIKAELLAESFSHKESPPIRVNYESRPLGKTFIDCFVIENRCVVKVLALRNKIRVADKAIIQSYLKHLSLKWGILVNFGKKKLHINIIGL